MTFFFSASRGDRRSQPSLVFQRRLRVDSVSKLRPLVDRRLRDYREPERGMYT